MTDPALECAREIFLQRKPMNFDCTAEIIRRYYAPLVEENRRLREACIKAQYAIANPIVWSRDFENEILDACRAALSPPEGTP